MQTKKGRRIACPLSGNDEKQACGLNGIGDLFGNYVQDNLPGFFGMVTVSPRHFFNNADNFLA